MRNSAGNKPISEALIPSYHFHPAVPYNPQLCPCFCLGVCTTPPKTGSLPGVGHKGPHRVLTGVPSAGLGLHSWWGRVETSSAGFAAGGKRRWNKAPGSWRGFSALLRVCRQFWFSNAIKAICDNCINF